jgi:hypothetical protein
VLTGYAPGAMLRDRISRMISPYRLLRWLGEVNWRHERGFDPDEPLTALRRALAGGCENAISDR